MAIIEVQLIPAADCGSPTCFYLDEDVVRSSLDAAYDTITSKAQEMASGRSIKKITYRDDEGDDCTFTQPSIPDALEFCEDNGELRVLKLTVVATEEAAPPALTEATPPLEATPEFEFAPPALTEATPPLEAAPEFEFAPPARTEGTPPSWAPANVTVTHSRKGAQIVAKEMKDGVVAWCDRPYTYEYVPAEMVGSTLYSSQHKPAGGGHFTVDAPAGAVVYIFCEAHRDGGFPALGWSSIPVGFGNFTWNDLKKKRTWGMTAWKKVHEGGSLDIPTVDCLVGGIAVHVQSSPAPTNEVSDADNEVSDADKLIETLRTMTLGLDIRKVLPKLAEIMLCVIDDTQIPELFQLLDPLVSLAEGSLDLNQLKLHIVMGMEVIRGLPDDTKQDLGARMLSAIMTVANDLRAEPSTVEIHLNVVCDGCEQCPITGPRYKCDLCGDYDLCGRCHARRHEFHHHELHADQDKWTVMKSNNHADVVGFTCGPCGPRITCDGCNKAPLSATDRHKCAICPDYDLCSNCYSQRATIHQHHESWLEFTAPEPQDEQVFCVPASDVPLGVPPPAPEPEIPTNSVEKDEKDGEHFYIGDGGLHPSVGAAALARLLAHPDETIRSATRQAICEAISAHDAPESGTEEKSPSDGGWEKPNQILEESCEEETAQASEEPAELEKAFEQEDCDLEPARSAKVLQAVMTFGDTEHAVYDFEEARGDVSSEFAGLISQYADVNQAFRLGHLSIVHGEAAVGALAKVIITNDGGSAWPDSTTLRAVAGPEYGFPELYLGSVPAGDTVEISLDLTFGPAHAGEAALSGWAMTDESGQPFGPLLLLEVSRV